MKNILCSFGIMALMFLTSCLKEDIIETPGVKEVKIYMTDKAGKDSLVTEVPSGKPVKIVVGTDADMCSVWPGGIREIMKKKVSTDGGVTFPDSIDMFNNPVLVKSDLYSDYGLVGARGLKTALSAEGWYCSYTYPKPGSFDLVVVVTNHGYDSYNFKPAVVPIGKIDVR
ncbi:hypothetical protein GCM10023091_41740 [Ravibacter arvi]|uniref:Uncharacterized protein n=1 Tax=Ravibacter arvi TaxID=2051041 RepID=A0ABP8MD95_9BACT